MREDSSTVAAYDAASAAFAQEWHAQPPPVDLHLALRRFFKPGLTADIGCGSGREIAWLTENGFEAIGYDASQGLLAEARQRYRACRFELAWMPDLEGLADESFDNVLCETVIMHLPVADIVPAVRRLTAILRPGGTLYLSWRVTKGGDRRDEQGRLYSAFDAGLVHHALAGAALLLDEEIVSASSGKIIHRIVARKLPENDQ